MCSDGAVTNKGRFARGGQESAADVLGRFARGNRETAADVCERCRDKPKGRLREATMSPPKMCSEGAATKGGRLCEATRRP